ncbi:hypothetical protein ACP4OV_027536 [Aristida adscensionis]
MRVSLSAMEGSSEERCALVAELAQVLETVGQLEAHLQLQGGAAAAAGGGDRSRALVSTMRASIDRSVHIARSCCAEGRLTGTTPESPPSGGDGSPRSAGSDHAGDSRGRGNAAGQCKKRKTLPKWSVQVRVSAVQDVAPLDDGLSWRKYGQKDILGAKYPRAYFRCTHRHTQGCQASKQVQRADGDPLLFDVVYHGHHTCAQAQAQPQPQPQPQPQGGTAAQPNNQRASPTLGAAASSEQSQLEQERSAAAFEGSPTMLTFPLPSNKAAGADAGGGATSRGFPAGRATASHFMSGATPECLVGSSSSDSYALGGGGGGMAGVRNVPDVELASTTNSPMGDMDFMFPLDDGFLDNPAYF